MANVFSTNKSAVEPSTLDIVRETLTVDGNGDVSFRCRYGRGSGKGLEVSGSQFDEFVTLLIQTRDSREALAQQQRDADAARVVAAASVVPAAQDDTEE